MKRRVFTKTALGAPLALALGCRNRTDGLPDWSSTVPEVLVQPVADYGQGLSGLLRQGLARFPDLAIRGKTVLLKINLVATSPERAINTDPRFVVAAAEAFRSLGAAAVTVADGPGHDRDIDHLLDRSGLGDLLDAADLRVIDLNHQPLVQVENARGETGLPTLYLPRPLLQSDLVVSLPKLKTHHWAGVTLSLKNMFGVMPGSVYGWPKNVFHWKQIDRSVFDINRAARAHFAMVDGIVGMEGDGPLDGEDVRLGRVVMGRDLAAVDVVASRLMGVDPLSIPHLRRVIDARSPNVAAGLRAASARAEAPDRPFRMPPNWPPSARPESANPPRDAPK